MFASKARRISRQERRAKDEQEVTIRRGRRYRHCYVHALSGQPGVPATHGDLCQEHFDEITYTHPGLRIV